MVLLVSALGACARLDSGGDANRGEQARSAPSAFDLQFENPDARVLDRTVATAASFDVVGGNTVAAATGVGVELRERFFLLTAHHTFRGVGVPNAAVMPLNSRAGPRITCLRQMEGEYCPTESLVLLALPDRDLALIGPFERSPTQEYVALEQGLLPSGELDESQLMFSWGYPYGYGPSFSRRRYAFTQSGPLLRDNQPLGTGLAVSTLYLRGSVSPGSSGSPLFSFAGDFVGIVNGGGSDRETGTAYVTAMPAWEFVPEFAELVSRLGDANTLTRIP